MDAEIRRDINNGLGKSHGGWELALAPVIFGLGGYWIDQQVGTMPIFTIALVVVAFAGVVAKTFYVYRYQFEREASMHNEVRAERIAAQRLEEQAIADREAAELEKAMRLAAEQSGVES